MKRNITIVIVSVIAALMVIGVMPVVGASDPSPQIIEVSYPSLVYDGQKATITVTAKNNGGFSDDGYISVSFPNDEDILESDVYGTGNDYNNLYPKGYWSLYNSTDQQMVSIDPLVELRDTNWGEGREERITMSVSPTGAEQIVFYVRVALKNSEGTFIRAPASSSYIDQQGWCVNRYTIDVVYPPPLLWKYKTDGSIGSVGISSDGNYVAAGSSDKNVYLFDNAGTQVWKNSTDGYVYSVDISSNGDYVAAGSSFWEDSSYNVYLFDSAGTQVWKKPTGGHVGSVSISSDGGYVAAGSSDGYAYLFDKAGTQVWKKQTGSVSSVSISNDENYVAVGSYDEYVYLFDSAGTQVWKKPTDGYVYSVDISSDGSYVAAGSSDNYVYLFDKTGARLWKNPAYSSVGSVSISSDGDYVASGTYSYGHDNNFSYFNNSGSKLWNYSIGTYKSALVSVSDDGSYMAAGSVHLDPFTVYFFNKAGALLWKENYLVNGAVRISSDGNYVAVGSGNYICLFDAFAELQMPLEYVPTSIATGDLNNNGLNDTVSSGTNVWNGNPVMNLHNQQSDHTFAEQEFFDDEVIASLSVGDLDGNGFDDMAGLYGTTDGFVYTGVRVWHQNEFGFGSYVDYTFGDLEPKSLSVDDMNDDELDDIAIIAGDNVYIFYQQTDHTFRNTPDYTLIWEYGSWLVSIITGDINNDGLNDIVVGHYGPSFSDVGISFFHQTGDHSFVAAPFDFGDINSMLSCSIGDLNNDGLNDIAIARYGISGSDVLIYYQQESCTFNIEEYPPHGEDADKIILTDPPWAISVCDLNDDGLDDVAVANGPQGIGGNGGLSIYYQKIEDIAPTFSINTDKSVYHTGETSEIEIAITNNMASSVTLLVSSEIYLPDKTTHRFLQKTITISPKDRKDVFYYYDLPDSTGYYRAKVSIQDENSGTVYGSDETSFYVQKECPIPESELEIEVYKDRSTYFYGNVFYSPDEWVTLGYEWKNSENGYKASPYNEPIRIAVKITDEKGHIAKNVDVECKLVNIDNPDEIISSSKGPQILDSQGLAIFVFQPKSTGNYYIDVMATKNNVLKSKSSSEIITIKNADFTVNFTANEHSYEMNKASYGLANLNDRKYIIEFKEGCSQSFDVSLKHTSAITFSEMKLVFDGLLYYTYEDSPVLNYGSMFKGEEKLRVLNLHTLTGYKYIRGIYASSFDNTAVNNYDYLTDPYITILFKYNAEQHSTQPMKLNDFGLYPQSAWASLDGDANTVGFAVANYGIKSFTHIVPGAYFPLAFAYDLYDFEEGIANPNMVNLPSTMEAGVGISAFGAKMLGIKSAAVALHTLSIPFTMGASFFSMCTLLVQVIEFEGEVDKWEEKFVTAAANKIWEDRPSNDLLIYYEEKSGLFLHSKKLNTHFVNVAPYDINVTIIYEPQGKTTFGDSFKRLNTIQKNFILKPGESKKENFAHSHFNHFIYSYVFRIKYKPVADNKNLFEQVTAINGDGIAISNARIGANRNNQKVHTDTFLKNDELFLELDLTQKYIDKYMNIFYEIAIYKDGSYIPRTAKKNTMRILGTEGNDLSYQHSFNKFNEGRYEIKAVLYTKENGDIIDEISIPFNVHNSQLGSISSSHQHANSILIESVLVDAVNQTPITEASVFANITNPDGLVETIELSENTAGNYSVIYENDTLPGIYHCKLFVDKSPYISMVDDFIFTKSPGDLNLIIQRTELTEGEAGDIQVMIDNPSEYQINDVSLSISSSSVLDMTVNQNKQIVGDIPAQQTKTVNITVIPQDIGKFDVLVYASSDDELIGIGTGEIKVLPPKEYGVELTAESYFKTVWSDSPQQINFTPYVQNTGDLEETVELYVSTPPNTTCNYPNYLTLMPNEIEEITIELNSDVLNNESIISIPVSAKIKETGEVQSITLNVNFNKLRPILEIEPHSVYTTINQGCGEKINLTLLETGGKVAPTNITWEVNWSNVIDPEITISIPSGFSIPANASKNLTMDILTANDIAPYNYIGYVLFRCDQGSTALVKIEIIVESISNQPSVTVLHPNGGESIPIGTQVQVSAHATDDTEVTSVTFSYSNNSGSDWNSIGAGAIVLGTDKDGIWNRTWNTNSFGAGSNYLIRAVADDGTSTRENQSDSTFSLTCTPPSAPTLNDPGTTDTDGNYTVAWSSVSGATSYTLEEDTSGSFGSPTVVYSGSGTSKYITGRRDGTYHYRVNACNACGCGGWSNVEDIEVSILHEEEGWNRTFGGTDGDVAYSVQQTSDGGFILAGYTDSYGAGDSDFWLVKTNSNGGEQWNMTFGGVGYDIARSVQQTSDGGYILTGCTNSYGAGSSDFWLVKTNSNGYILWDTTFGGTGWDMAESVQQTSDGGFILAGYTGSYGDVFYDAWLVKVDCNGCVQWNMAFGGSGRDVAESVQQTSDGGYIIAGSTQPQGSYLFSTGFMNPLGVDFADAWLVKIDSNGTKQWDKTFGGTAWDTAESVQETSDSGFILAGYTKSYGDGDSDFWLIKTDSEGHKEWDKTFGETDGNYAYSVQQTSDGGYILAGVTKPHSDPPAPLAISMSPCGAGGYEVWMVKTDSEGGKEWDKTFGGIDDDYATSVQQTSDGGYVVAGCTNSYGAGGSDFWLIKLGTAAQMRGDLNSDNQITPADAAIALRLAATGGWDSAADVNHDNHITSLDALMILQAAADAITL